MQTHNRIIYHCLCCGRLVHAEPETPVPNCCERPMVNAAAETVSDDDSLAECGCHTTEAGPHFALPRVPR